MAVSADQRAILEEIRVNLAGLQAELRKMSDNMRDNLSKMVAACNGIINTCSSVSKSVMVSDDGITEVDTSLDVEAEDVDSLEKVAHSKDGQIGDALNLFDEMLLRLAPQENPTNSSARAAICEEPMVPYSNIGVLNGFNLCNGSLLPPLKTANGYIVVPVRSNNSFNCPSKRDMTSRHEWRPECVSLQLFRFFLHVDIYANFN
ncbi:hypothetical protein ACHQM5_005824 [Ranunculus cassubicifolius]